MAKYTIDDIARLTNEDVREHDIPVINEGDKSVGSAKGKGTQPSAEEQDEILKRVNAMPPKYVRSETPEPKLAAQLASSERTAAHVAKSRTARGVSPVAGKDEEPYTGSGKGKTFANKMKRKDLELTGKHDVQHRKPTAAQEKQKRRNKKQLENLHGGKKGSDKEKAEPRPLSDSINRLMYMLQEAETKIISTRERNKYMPGFDSLAKPAMTWFQTQYNRLKARFNGGSNNPEFQKAVAELKRKADEAKRKGAADFNDEPGIAGPGNQHTNDMHSKHHPVNAPADPDHRAAMMLQRRRSYETNKLGAQDYAGMEADPSKEPKPPVNMHQRMAQMNAGWNWDRNENRWHKRPSDNWRKKDRKPGQ